MHAIIKKVIREVPLLLQALIQAFSKDPDFGSITAGVKSGMKEQLVSGLSGSARQIMLAALHQEMDRPLLVVTHNMFSAQKMAEDLQEALSTDQVLIYPANELVAAEAAVSSPETLAQRIEVLVRCAQGFRGIVVIPFSGVRRYVPVPEVMANAQIQIKQGNTLQLDSFLLEMVTLGYERVERVESRGQMSVRGGIIDFYPMTSSIAYRVELFDDEIDSIRTFDPADQRSIERIEEITVLPCKELIADRERMEKAADTAALLLEQQLEKMTDRQAKLRLREEMHREIELLRQHVYFSEMYKYISPLYPEKKTIYDYMPEDTILVLDEPARLSETSKQLDRDESEWNLHLIQNGKTLPDLSLSADGDELLYERGFGLELWGD